MGHEGQVMRKQAVESSLGFLGPISAPIGRISYLIPSQLRQSCLSVHGGGGSRAGGRRRARIEVAPAQGAIPGILRFGTNE